MNGQLPAAGDVVTATVTKSLPLGVLVEYAGMPGLVKGVESASGDEVSLRVIEFDSAQRRFSAEPA